MVPGNEAERLPLLLSYLFGEKCGRPGLTGSGNSPAGAGRGGASPPAAWRTPWCSYSASRLRFSRPETADFVTSARSSAGSALRRRFGTCEKAAGEPANEGLSGTRPHQMAPSAQFSRSRYIRSGMVNWHGTSTQEPRKARMVSGSTTLQVSTTAEATQGKRPSLSSQKERTPTANLQKGKR